jgi:hypothetical protein
VSKPLADVPHRLRVFSSHFEILGKQNLMFSLSLDPNRVRMLTQLEVMDREGESKKSFGNSQTLSKTGTE